jgi:hypothetical protein
MGSGGSAGRPRGELTVLVLMASTVPMLALGSGIKFADRGEHSPKGVPRTWQPFAVENY